MKLEELKEVLKSNGPWDIQSAVVWNVVTHEVEVDGCSVEYAVNRYGEWDIIRVGAVDNKLILGLRR